MFGALCYEIRCRQHSFEVMWSLRKNTLASFCQNHKGVFRDSENSGGIFALVCSEKMFCLEVKYWACPSRDLAQVTWFEIELPQTGSPLHTNTLPLQDRYAIVNYADVEGGEKKKKKCFRQGIAVSYCSWSQFTFWNSTSKRKYCISIIGVSSLKCLKYSKFLIQFCDGEFLFSQRHPVVWDPPAIVVCTFSREPELIKEYRASQS